MRVLPLRRRGAIPENLADRGVTKQATAYDSRPRAMSIIDVMLDALELIADGAADSQAVATLALARIDALQQPQCNKR